MVAETSIGVKDLVAPLFVREGIDDPRRCPRMPGVVQHTVASLVKEARRLCELGVPALVLFGVPVHKDAEGSQAWAPDGIVQVALASLRQELGPEMVLIADLCLDEYTDHGHCGVLDDRGEVANDPTVALYGRVALAQARAGADIVAPSGMMDGQVAAIRTALDEDGHTEVGILAYAAKFASALYGPFRDAVDVTIAGGGNRRGYQQDPRNTREAVREAELDVAEGADMVMVKPAIAYLDIIAAVRQAVRVPVAAYHVSGEYAMVKAAAERGWLDGTAVALEHLGAIKRAGADMVLTYFAAEVAEILGPVTGQPVTGQPVTGQTDVTNQSLFERACRVSPGGVNSPVRAFRAVGARPTSWPGAKGPTSGTSRAPLHRLRPVLRRVDPRPRPSQGRRGHQAGGRPGDDLRGAHRGRGPAGRSHLRAGARLPGVRLVSSGTEAAMSAVRLARGATGRDQVVLFSGCYHGHSDGLLAGGGSGVATLGLPTSAGVPAAAVAETLVAPYNRVPQIGRDVAAVIVEPVAANMGLVPPEPGFLEGLRQECDRAGALLIFDEVITGFRVGPGGASRLFGVTPDLWCFGKVIGGGLPLAAFGGRREVMEQLAPLGPVYQAGTLSGNPVATAAGLAVLSLLEDAAYKELAAWAGRLGAGLAAAAQEAGLASRSRWLARWSGSSSGPAP